MLILLSTAMRHIVSSVILAAFLLLAASSPAPADAQARRQKILVLHSYHQGLEWTDNITSGIQEVFSPYAREYEIYYEYLDSKRNAGNAYQANLYQLLKAKQWNLEFSVIIVSDNDALNFIIAHGRELYGDTPIVFCGINNFSTEMLAGRTNVTGVAENTDFEGTLKLIQKFHPERKNITVIVDRTSTGTAIRASMTPVLPRFPELNFIFYQDFLLSEVNARLKTLGAQDVIYLLAFNRDRDDNFISYTEGIEMVSGATGVPIYGSWDFYMGKGIVGGILTRGIDQGRTAARMALSILNGSEPSAIPIDYTCATVPMFDFTQLKQFKISTDQLPQGSLVINAPPTWVERYANKIFILFCRLLVISSGMGVRLYIARRRHHRIEETARILEEKVISRTRLLAEEKAKLEVTLAQVKTLQGLLPICAACKKIRDDRGYWSQIETYISNHTDTVFSHGICPDCARRLYSDLLSPE